MARSGCAPRRPLRGAARAAVPLPAVGLLAGLLAALPAAVAGRSLFFDPAAVKHACVQPAAPHASNTTFRNTPSPHLTPGVPVHLADVNTTDDEATLLLVPLADDGWVDPLTGDDSHGGGRALCALHRWTRPLEERGSGRKAAAGHYLPLGRSVPGVPAEGDPANATSAVDAGYGRDGDWTRMPGKGGSGLRFRCGEAADAGDHFERGEYLCEVSVANQHNRMLPEFQTLTQMPALLHEPRSARPPVRWSSPRRPRPTSSTPRSRTTWTPRTT